ncbi:MAG: Fe-only/vanadium nitrogenase subunit delta [Bacillota bacterium]
MEEQTLTLYSFIQERYLWQYYSRTWDREENIHHIMDEFVKILSGVTTVGASPKERYFYAEAATVAAETKRKFPWLGKLDRAELESLAASVKAKLLDVMVARSQNGELNVPYY